MSAREPDGIEPAPVALLWAGAFVVAVVVAAAGTFAFRAMTPAQVAQPMAGEATAAADMERADLEAAVTADPDDLATRLQLAHDYFDASDYDLALEHYLVVLEQRPTHARSLARAGWIAFEGGDNETAERLVTQSLGVNPSDAEALWFLAHVRLYGLRDPQGAQVALGRLLARDDLSDGFRVQVEVLWDRAGEQL